MKSNGEKKVSFQTVGCRLNQYETERIAAQLQPYGFKRVASGEAADLYIINTCTVTLRADSDCRYLIRRAHRENPAGRIVVVGCYVENEPDRVAALEGVDVVVGNREKDAIAQILPGKLPELFDREPYKNCSTTLTDFHEHNRAWIKISDGCNQRCSFCLVTIVRGNLVNRPAQEIIDEIKALVAHDYKEVVLTGVNIGYYSDRSVKPPVTNLAELCQMILDETDLYRLRLSSLEPQSVDKSIVKTFAESKGRICRHFHLPLQSASPKILRQMHRPYDCKLYVESVTKLKEAVPDTIIGADVIVGFPGETDEDFDSTCRLCESGPLDYLHVFSYSDRPGTMACELSDKVNHGVIRERNRILTRISNELRFNSHRRQLGKTLEFISEHKQTDEGYFWGISDNYLRVKLPGWAGGSKEIVKVKITSAHEDHMEGEIITRS
ncbi:MAG: tRNA (N(6)-L-threonylcarbamoyladenosine(37)-C(2))-methylthiotransferase MtaB [Candidatus Zixiibacteriota bacterium]